MNIHRGCQGLLVLVCVGAVTASCAKDGAHSDPTTTSGIPSDPLLTQPAAASEMRLTSPAFEANGTIPDQYTCFGSNVSPPLSLSGVPSNAQSLVLVIDDPDAPDPAAPKQDWIHWIVLDLPTATTTIAEAIAALPAPAQAGVNDFGKTQYGGPCPPKGQHRYFFRLYALDRSLGLTAPNLGALRSAVTGHVLGSTSLMGTVGAR